MKKILVIEDTPDILENITTILRFEKFQALTARDGQRGLQLAQEQKPDLIICDILMPGLDGYEVLIKLRQDPTTATIPFIFLTAKASKEDWRRGMNIGADDYLTKPFTAQELLTVIRTRLEKHTEIVRRSEEKLETLRSHIGYALPHEFRTPFSSKHQDSKNRSHHERHK